MFRKNQLVWKVNGVILLILTLVLGVSSYVTNLADERAALVSARDVSGVISQTVLQAMRGLMMTRDTAGVGVLFGRLRSENPVYEDLRLVSHGGEVIVSSRNPDQLRLDRETWLCSKCHGPTESPGESAFGPFDEVVESRTGGRVISVVNPIRREEGCGNSQCHSETGASAILGFLQTDYSLGRVDDLIAQRVMRTALALLVSLVLCAGATWWMIDRLVGSRIRTLRDGADRIARKDLTFRFGDTRSDGIARLSSTFDGMVSELSDTVFELTNTKEYLQGIVESSADIIITVDPDGLIRTFNAGAEEALGYERGEVIGRRIEMLFADPKERDVAIAGLRHSDNVSNYETHFLTKTGAVRDVILTLSRLRTPDGIPVGTFGISKDVTEERKLLRELVLKERLAAIGEAVTGIHHTLKNMLGSMKGGSYMVRIGLAEEDRDLLGRGWAMVQDGIDHVTHLSSKMLQYVREWELEIQVIPLRELVADLNDAAEEAARSYGIDIRFEATPGSQWVACDPRLLHSAVTDLVINALEACEAKEYGVEEGPEVGLRAFGADDGRQVVVEVWDNGQGMTEEIKENIFNPFFTTKKSTGTGLGLALAMRIARLHGGTIDVESKPGCGSTFRISLPVGSLQERKEETNAQTSPGR